MKAQYFDPLHLVSNTLPNPSENMKPKRVTLFSLWNIYLASTKKNLKFQVDPTSQTGVMADSNSGVNQSQAKKFAVGSVLSEVLLSVNMASVFCPKKVKNPPNNP